MVVHHLYDALHHDLDWSGQGHALEGHSHDWKLAQRSVNLQLHGVRALRDAHAQGNKQRLVLRALMVVVCGCLSVMPCELVVKRDAQGMRLMNVATYLFSIVSSLAASGGSVLSARKIPLRSHLLIVVAGYGFNQLSSVAFAMGLPMPVALVVKNGGLLCQMLVAAALLGEAFSMAQVASAVAVTLGIIVTVLSNAKPKAPAGSDPAESSSSAPDAALPALILLGAMLARALGNAVSQTSFKEHGKMYNEVLFYQHALGLPLLLLEWRSLISQSQAWSLTPILWAYLAVTMALNYVVTKACTELVGLSNSVVLNVVLTIQRFLSIVISAVVFNAPPYPPLLMWLGACFVVGGCVAFVLGPAPEKKEIMGTGKQK